jgi:polyketide cyclase/dehydrase/lipid transport protein
MRVKETIEIARSPDEVWAFVADHANDPRWCKKVKSVESAGAGRWQVWHKPVPLRPPVTLLVEQLELDPPRQLKLREEDQASVFEVEYRLEGTERGTSFTQISDFEWKTLPRFLHKGFARGVQRDVRHQLQELKRMLEAQ